MYGGGIIKEYNLEEILNSFLPKLFYEIEYDEWGVTIRVPELVRYKVLHRLRVRLPGMFEIIGIQSDLKGMDSKVWITKGGSD